MIETARPVVIAGSQTTYQLNGKKELVFERTYDAPPERVFTAFCDPKLVPQWWGSVGAKLVVETMDVRAGGKWRFIETDAKGKKSTFHGEYREVVPPTRIASTFRYGAGIMGALMSFQEVYEFVPVGGKTLLRLTSTYPMGAALKGMMNVGMESPGKYTEGSRHQWRLDRLAAFVGKAK